MLLKWTFSPTILITNCSKEMMWAVNNPLFHDVTFVVGNGENKTRFAAHKAILSARSPYFYAMFTGNMKV